MSGAAPSRSALAGLTVIEIGGGAAAAYCGRLLVDAGATVSLVALDEARRLAGVVRSQDPAETRHAQMLHAGKLSLPANTDPHALVEACAAADLVIVGEDSGFDAGRFASAGVGPRIACIDLSWFGHRPGPWHDWAGSDLVVQALTGLPQMAGHIEGPPTFFGDRQSTVVGGVTAYIAACAALLAPATARAHRYEVSILEANIVLSEMHMHFFERDGIPMQRCGLNRFFPNSPVGVYPCRDGWVGITITTPDQWRSLCKALDLRELAADEGLVTRELRFARQDDVEAAMRGALAQRTAFEWAAIGREHKVPIVVVPDAAGILTHPIFQARHSLADVTVDEHRVQVPRSPFALSRTPVRTVLDAAVDSAQPEPVDAFAPASDTPDAPPLAGVTVIDFAMGWAGPLASRLLGDLGADIVKIEAARYPDWWRGVNWTPEYIRDKGYEMARNFLALNRGKRGVSLDLTTDTGRELALALIAGADMIVENQASGVLAKLGLGYEQVTRVNPEIVMVSMSAFGSGNDWSDTRAYGSTLEQGAGLPQFMGFPDDPPTMAHLAYGDPVGGLFGCAAGLTAMVERRRSGRGQYANVSMIEAMLQFATPALLAHQLDPLGVRRTGNRHIACAPHGFFAAAGDDQWIAVAVDSGAAFAQLARLIGREDWARDPSLTGPDSLSHRQARQDEFEEALQDWARTQEPRQAAADLQAAGVAAAPLLHAEELFDIPHFTAADFYIELVRELTGPQRQVGIAIMRDGARLGNRRPAPLLGEHSWEQLSTRLGIDRAQFEALLAAGVVSFAPAPSRNLVAAAPTS